MSTEADAEQTATELLDANQEAPLSDKARCVMLQEQNAALQEELHKAKNAARANDRRWRSATVAIAAIEHAIAEFRSEQ